jgi:hypothetical protein
VAVVVKMLKALAVEQRRGQVVREVVAEVVLLLILLVKMERLVQLILAVVVVADPKAARPVQEDRALSFFATPATFNILLAAQ